MRLCFFGCNLDVGSAPPESGLATGNAIGSEFSELRAIIDHIQIEQELPVVGKRVSRACSRTSDTSRFLQRCSVIFRWPV